VERIAGNGDDGLLTKPLSFGRRFSRDCFLVIGGALVLIAFGSLMANLIGMVRAGDWSVGEVGAIVFIAALFAVPGTVFLVSAYGLLKSRRWAVKFAAISSALALTVMAVAVATEHVDREGFATSLLFYALPLSLTLVWALIEVARESKERQAIERTEG
jgi:hypothetical protein